MAHSGTTAQALAEIRQLFAREQGREVETKARSRSVAWRTPRRCLRSSS